MEILAGIILMALGGLIGYEIGNSAGFFDGFEVGRKISKNYGEYR